MLREATTREWITKSAWTYSHEIVSTADGCRLNLHRLRAAHPVSNIPVALIPGHGTTAWTFFGGEQAGIAGALATAGRDVWVLDPRGCGTSRHLRENSTVRIADKLAHDLPAFFSHIMSRTGADCIDAVGHSLGGILIYLHSLTRPRNVIRRAVTLGSPVRIPRAVVPPALRTRAVEAFARRLGRVPLSKLTETVSKWAGTNWMPVHFDPEGIEANDFEAFLRSGVADVYGHELQEMVRWIRTGEITSLAYSTKLEHGRLPMPTRFIVGANDVLTTPEAVAHAHDSIGGAERELHILGTATGTKHDYRHTDILIGRRVQSEVAPLIADWLEVPKARAHLVSVV